MSHTISPGAPLLSGYTTLFNAERVGLPYRESIRSMLQCCDEIVVMDGGSEDGTVEGVQELMQQDGRIRLLQSPYDPKFPLMDGSQKQLARMACTGNAVLQLDADEVLSDGCGPWIKEAVKGLITRNPQAVMALPVINLIGSEQAADCAGTPWKWRLSPNRRDWGHGVHLASRRLSPSGQMYSAYTDGCEWVSLPIGEWLPVVGFGAQAHPSDPFKMAHQLQQAININMPLVWHYSGASVARKLRMARDFWHDQWLAIRNGEDGAETKFWGIDPRGKTDEELAEHAKKLEADWLTYPVRATPPAMMADWMKRMGVPRSEEW